MSSVTPVYLPTIYKPQITLLFILGSLALHALGLGYAYKAGVFSPEELSSTPADIISFTLVMPSAAVAPITPPQPVPPPPPKIKKVLKKKITTTSSIAKKKLPIKKKPVKKKVKKPAPVIVKKTDVIKQEKKVAASPIPHPVNKRAKFVSPQPIYQPKPRYPMSARRRGQEGTVIFRISLSNSGTVTNAMMLESSGSSAIDRAALKTIKTWKFPASAFNSLATFQQKIVFRLNSY